MCKISIGTQERWSLSSLEIDIDSWADIITIVHTASQTNNKFKDSH